MTGRAVAGLVRRRRMVFFLEQPQNLAASGSLRT